MRRLPVATALAFVLYAITSTPEFARACLDASKWGELGRVCAQALLLAGIVAYYARQRTAERIDFGLAPPSLVRATKFFVVCGLVAAAAVLGGYFAAQVTATPSGHLESSRAIVQQLPSLQATYGPLWWFGVLVYGVVNPLTEELLFRALMVTGWRTVMGRVPACILSAAVSALVHVEIYDRGWATFGFQATLQGFFAAAYLRTGSLWLTLALHVGANVGIFGANSYIIMMGEADRNLS